MTDTATMESARTEGRMMYEELLAAIAKLTVAVNGVAATLALILVVLVLKNTNSAAEIRSLQNDVKNVRASISELSRSLCKELRLRRQKDDV